MSNIRSLVLNTQRKHWVSKHGWLLACLLLLPWGCTPADSATADGGRVDHGISRDTVSSPPQSDYGSSDVPLHPGWDGAVPGDVGHPPADSAIAPECFDDTQCGQGRRCLEGICRDDCLVGLFCLEGTPSGEHCREGHCVECTDDSHCPGNRFQCDPLTWVCVDRPFDPTFTKIGMFYSTWHCPIANASQVWDISEILAGNQSWGPERKFHYWDKPTAGYYCLSQNDALLTQHAEQLRDAGIDFVFLDVTNHNYVGSGSDRTTEMIIAPLDRMLAVWSTIPDAPQIVPWVPVEKDGVDPAKYTIDAILQRLGAHPQMHFSYLGKPLILVTENVEHPVSAARLASLAVNYTVRKMWAHIYTDSPMWSFMQGCANWTPAKGELCQQRAATFNGAMEQLPISAAYQATYMNLPTANPKLQGLTFRKQFETLLLNPMVPIATITGWNEWIAQRIPCDEHPACPCGTYPAGCFMDQYDMEYSRDIEPAQNAMGDYYYRLLQACVALFRSGGMCDAAHAGDLCCKDY